MAPTPASDEADAGTEAALPTPPAQSLRQKALGDAATPVAGAATVPNPMGDSSAPVEGDAGSKEEGPMSPAEGGSLRARGLVLTWGLATVVTILLLMRFRGHLMSQVLILSVSICLYIFFLLLCIWQSRWFYTEFVLLSVTILLLLRFHGHPMIQVWILSVSICLCVFFLLCIWRSRPLYTEFVLLSYGPLLAFVSASVIGSTTAIFVLFFSTVWAAGNLGNSLAVHRLRKGSEPAIHALPSPSCPTRDSVNKLNFFLYIGEPILVLLWTLVMALIVYVTDLTDELDIFMLLLYFGWIHVDAWVIFVALVPMHGVLLREWMDWLLASLLLWMLFSPLLCLVSQILPVLCHLLLLVALVTFLWYNLAIYMHFLATATHSTTTQGNEDTLRTEVKTEPEVKTGQMKSDTLL